MKAVISILIFALSVSFAHADCGQLNSKKILKDTASVELIFKGVLNRNPRYDKNSVINQLDGRIVELEWTINTAQSALECYEANGVIVSYDASIKDELAIIRQLADLREKIIIRDSALMNSYREDVMKATNRVIQLARGTLAKIKNAKVN